MDYLFRIFVYGDNSDGSQVTSLGQKHPPCWELTTYTPLYILLSYNLYDHLVCLYSSSMDNLDKMFEAGLFINDLSMHDSSRDLVLAGTQQRAELKLALDQV